MAIWWRAYTEAATDPKLQLLPPELFRTWFNLMCIASSNGGELPALAHIAYTLQMKPEKTAQALSQLHRHGLLDKTEAGFKPHNWDGRQYKSDRDATAAERSKRYRNARRDANSSVTRDATESSRPPETEPEPETEKISKLRLDSAPAKRGTRLPSDWNPSPQDLNEACRKLGGAEPASQELDKFRDHWKAAPGQRGVKLDWDATWRNWIRNAKGPTNGHRTANPRTTGHDAFLAVATRKAREMFGDGDVAGPANAAEFPFGNGAFSGGSSGSGAPTCATATDDNGGKPRSDGVLEGEIFPPDQAADGLSNGRRHH